jgi:hypothetical protein
MFPFQNQSLEMMRGDYDFLLQTSIYLFILNVTRYIMMFISITTPIRYSQYLTHGLADLVSECKIKETHILVNAMDFYFCGRKKCFKCGQVFF